MYGQVAASLRHTMTELLKAQRISLYLGKGSGFTNGKDITTPAERRAAVERILRYRAEIVDYLARAAETVIPPGAMTGWEAPLRVARWLRTRVPDVGQLPDGRRATMDELATVQDLPLAEWWRMAAVAAVTGRERELPRFPDLVDIAQARVVMYDVGQLTNALLALDVRYLRTPGWRTLGPNAHLWADRANQVILSPVTSALLCAKWGESWTPDDVAAADRLGYRPTDTALVRTGAFGVAGAIAAQHNVVVRLNAMVPSADAVVAIARTQRLESALARTLAISAGEADLANGSRRRAERYARLLGALTKDVAGTCGGGASIVADGNAALLGLSDAVEAGEPVTVDQLEWLASLFAMTDSRLGDAIHQGIADGRYFVAHDYQLEGVALGGVRHAVRRFEPLNKETHPEVLRMVNDFDDAAWAKPKVIVSGDEVKGRQDFGAIVGELAARRPERRSVRGQGRGSAEYARPREASSPAVVGR
ncbi:MAG: hypothetical protein FWF90_09215 [Promicromonosporaceae bacterium]|nr:hypothetical protein [Promicromonosporaceae bacterium]